MVKLHVSPGACSMSCHIAFEEARLKFEPVIGKWDEITKLNPMHAVPVLVLDDGKVLTQNIAILHWAAEQAPQADLMPRAGSWERLQALQWLSWVAADLHHGMGPLFNDKLPEAEAKEVEKNVHRMLAIAEKHMEGRKFLAGESLTIADCYFFAVYGWHRMLEIPVENYRNLNAFASRLAERPAVQTVLKREGLLK